MYSLYSLHLTFCILCVKLDLTALMGKNKNPRILLQGFCVWGNYQKVGILSRSYYYRQPLIKYGCI